MKYATVKVFQRGESQIVTIGNQAAELPCTPHRWRYIDCAVVWQEEGRCGLQVPGAEGVWEFVNGFCSENFHGIGPAKIELWLPPGEEPAEQDRFEGVTQENTPADMWRYLAQKSSDTSWVHIDSRTDQAKWSNSRD